jgi:hypothetical protein
MMGGHAQHAEIASKTFKGKCGTLRRIFLETSLNQGKDALFDGRFVV